jgi:HSP20 family protein
MTLMRHRPALTDLAAVRDELEHLFEDWLPRQAWWSEDGGRADRPALDLYATDTDIVAKVALPGVKPEDVDVTVANDVVTVTGRYEEREEATEAGYVRKELSRGSFSRAFSLPAPVKADAAKATFKDGLLTLTLPKTEPAATQRIKVQAA